MVLTHPLLRKPQSPRGGGIAHIAQWLDTTGLMLQRHPMFQKCCSEPGHKIPTHMLFTQQLCSPAVEGDLSSAKSALSSVTKRTWCRTWGRHERNGFARLAIGAPYWDRYFELRQATIRFFAKLLAICLRSSFGAGEVNLRRAGWPPSH